MMKILHISESTLTRYKCYKLIWSLSFSTCSAFFYLNFIKSIELDIFPVQWFKFKHFMFFYVYHGQKCCFIVNSNSNAAIYNVTSCLRERMRVTRAASERMRAAPWARVKKVEILLVVHARVDMCGLENNVYYAYHTNHLRFEYVDRVGFRNTRPI